MTVIAWDGQILAADRLMIKHGTRFTVCKVSRFAGGLIAVAGSISSGMAMRAWICDGADPKTFPDCQKDKDDWADALVIRREDCSVWLYERTAYPYEFKDNRIAIGSGKDCALTAMFLGRNACEAVEIAQQFDSGCGGGVDWLTLDDAKATNDAPLIGWYEKPAKFPFKGEPESPERANQ